MCGESWLAIKDSLTHRPSSQGWAPGALLPCCVVFLCVVWCVCVFLCLSVLFWCVMEEVGIPFLIALSGWYATYNNSMYMFRPDAQLVRLSNWYPIEQPAIRLNNRLSGCTTGYPVAQPAVRIRNPLENPSGSTGQYGTNHLDAQPRACVLGPHG